MPISLDQLRVHSPCTKSWHELSGDVTKRFCDECNLHVHNLSAMSRSEVETLVGQTSGRLCVGYVPTHEGTPKLLDYQPVSRDLGRNRRWIWGGSVAAVFVALFQTASWGRKPAAPPWMGKTKVPTTQTTRPAIVEEMSAPSTHPSDAPSLLGTPLPIPTTPPAEPKLLGDVYLPTSKPARE